MASKFQTTLLAHGYFPERAEKIPFGEMLNRLFFKPIVEDNLDFPLHGPNAIRFLEALAEGDFTREKDLAKDDAVEDEYGSHYPAIINALEADLPNARKKVIELLKVASLFHDIGKTIRRANHPPVGANLIRNYDEEQRRRLVESLVYKDDPSSESKHNRFSLISSIIQHHDKFGVVSTGEGGLPLFSDILYFTSDATAIQGIKKNITSVMLANLSDIAAVCTAPEETQIQALKFANEIYELRTQKASPSAEKEKITQLLEICKSDVCLGLDKQKVQKVLEDWEVLIKLVCDERVQGDRVRLKHHLLELERNPARAIKRILRLFETCATTSNCDCLVDTRFMSPTSVESILVGTLGAHQFQTFCELLATVVKLDYALKFFKAIVCASVRKEIHDNYSVNADREKKRNYAKIDDEERQELDKLTLDQKEKLTNKIATLFVKTIEGLLNRYIGVLGYAVSSDPRRFGFQMRALAQDEKIRDTIIDLLCVQEHKDPIALTWLVDEVTIWSMD